MIFSLKKTIFLFCIFSCFFISINVNSQQHFEKQKSTKALIKEARLLRYNNFNDAINLLDLNYKSLLKKGDTVEALNVLLELTNTHSMRASYTKSYNNFCNSLFLVRKLKNRVVKASAFIKIGRLFNLYKRKNESFKYLKISITINKSLVKEGVLPKGILVDNHYAYCSTYRELNDFENAKKHLDSAFIYYNKKSKININYLNFENAIIFSEENDQKKAIEFLEKTLPWFQKNDPSYLVIAYTYLADIYNKDSNFKKSRNFYQKALKTSKIYNAHIDFTPVINEKLSKLYFKQKNYVKAYDILNKGKKLEYQFFDSRNWNNNILSEINNTIQTEKKHEEELLLQQQINKLEQEDKTLMLQRVVLVVISISLIIIGFIYLSYLKSKHLNEKKLAKKKQEFEINKTNELMELKNKELAGFALQLAEKDEYLKLLKNKLKGGNDEIDIQEIKQLSKSITISNARSWQEFKLRFTAVNEIFYKNLSTKHPNLNQKDLKMCALVKVNLSNKNIANLLGISVESVHTSRYRLRKKLGLDAGTNLDDFIAAL